MRTRDPASFWQENVMAAVIVLRVPARMSPGNGGNKLSNAISVTILGSGEGLTSFEKNNGANFSDGKKVQWSFVGIYFLRIREKTFSLISSTLLLLSSNVKVSNVVVKKINKLCKVKTSLSKTNRANVFGNKNVKKKKKKKKKTNYAFRGVHILRIYTTERYVESRSCSCLRLRIKVSNVCRVQAQ